MASLLTTSNHSRDSAGLNYIYPVLSRRAGGLSIGINFNTNNACNWRCIYCQVPDLTIGAAPPMDFELLAEELRYFLGEVANGHLFERYQLKAHECALKDIALSGNGEPTSLSGFAEAVELIGQIATEFGVLPHSHFVLITNGSLVHQAKVQEGLKILNRYGGEVWFKLDSATEQGRALMNNAGQGLQAGIANLRLCTTLCVTKLQVCLLDYDGRGLLEVEKQAFLSLLKQLKTEVSLEHIMLYTLARQACQPEAPHIKKLDESHMNALADEIRGLNYLVTVSP